MLVTGLCYWVDEAKDCLLIQSERAKIPYDSQSICQRAHSALDPLKTEILS